MLEANGLTTETIGCIKDGQQILFCSEDLKQSAFYMLTNDHAEVFNDALF